ncbi:hypothetical protein [Acinetobacter sp.]|uniref:hypothetical protein n=1 Tax=Acinetobacter sp. TaxID=472 RepID=UPI003981C940
MNEQKNECGCVCRDLLGKLIEQNKSLIEHNNQVMQQSNKVIEQNNQLIQINNEQAAQINHLLEHLDLEGESKGSGYLDG